MHEDALDISSDTCTRQIVQLAGADQFYRLHRSRRGTYATRAGTHSAALPAALVTTLRGTALLVGLIGYGFSMALMVRAGLGLDPWDVFHQGLAHHTGMTIGIASAVVGVAVLLAWIPLRASNRRGVIRRNI